MQQKMCLKCLCVSAHIHALTAYKQQYRFNYRKPSSCLWLSFSVSGCVIAFFLYVFWGKCVAVEIGWTVSVGENLVLHSGVTFMSKGSRVWLLINSKSCCMCLLTSVHVNTCVSMISATINHYLFKLFEKREIPYQKTIRHTVTSSHPNLTVPGLSFMVGLCDDMVVWSIRGIPTCDIYGPASLPAIVTTPTPFNLTVVIYCHCLTTTALDSCQLTHRHCMCVYSAVCGLESVNVRPLKYNTTLECAICQSNVEQKW